MEIARTGFIDTVATMIDDPPLKPRCAASPSRQAAMFAISLRAGTMIAMSGKGASVVSGAGRPSDAARCVRNWRKMRSSNQAIRPAQTAPATSAVI